MLMPQDTNQLREFHWMMDMLQSIDVGLVVLNTNNEVEVWNSFMENHSGKIASKAKGKNIFSLFPEIQEDWFKQKVRSVIELKTRAFSIWEQRPYLFKFKNYRPITGVVEYMYQNISILPITSASGEVTNICIIVYDVTDIATSQIALGNLNAQLEKVNRIDQLTQLYNRAYWQETQAKMFSQFKRNPLPVSMVIFDIDHFKLVNDTYGHQCGDDVIKACANQLKLNSREVDICGRYSSEEFVVLLYDAQAKGGYVFAERLRKTIEQLEVKSGEHIIRFTISLGVCELTPAIKNTSQWLSYADQALHHAKEIGRNKTSVARPE